MSAAHPVPDAALDQDVATIAQKGAGKTYANRGLVERLLDLRRRVVIVDPLNTWWGLKAKADGTPGYAIAVVGGPNADVALDPTKGEELAAFVAGSAMSIVVDVSALSRAELVRFSHAFLGGLYKLNRDALWLVLEEADVFAPQQPMGDGAAELLHVVNNIARRGRAFGFRLFTITQRPARLHKDVLTQTSTLIMLRLRSPQDRAAAEEWIKGNADPAEARTIVAGLASLPVGEGWIWAPDLSLLEQVKFPPIKTLDTSSTPEAGAQRPAAAALASADVDSLRAALAAPDAPPPAAGALASPGDRKSYVAAQAAAEQRGYQRGLEDGRREEWARAMGVAQARTGAALQQLLEDLKAEAAGAPAKAPAAPAPPAPPTSTAPADPAPSPTPTAASAELAKGGRHVLAALQAAPRPVTWDELFLLACMSPTAGWSRKAKKDLVEAGAVLEAEGRVRPAEPPVVLIAPVHSADLVEAWARKVGGAGAKILRHLYVRGLQTAAQVSAELEISESAGWTRKGWKDLRKNNLVDQPAGGGGYQLAPIILELKEAEGGR